MSRRIDQLDTPSLVVDLDAFEANVHACFERLADVDVRPHQKTAKSPPVARLLIEAGAAGICVAKLSEAEVMLAHGIHDVLITTELVGSIKARRLADLLRSSPESNVKVVVDSWEGARTLDAALDRPLDALIDVNVAQNRCGVEPDAAASFAARLADLEQLRLIGVQGYEGNLQHVRNARDRRRLCDAAMLRLASAVEGLRAAGLRIDVVSTGGTGTAGFCAAHEVVTEVQPGSFIFMDADYIDTGGVIYQPALRVLATVISHPTPDRAVIDAGLKTLSDDSGPARLLDAPGWQYRHGGDEHGLLTPIESAHRRRLRVGDRVALMPSHIDTTVNLHDRLYAHRHGVIEAEWPVAARGMVQ